MATREPKTRAITQIEVIGRSGSRKGRIEMTSGNVTYFRQGSQAPTSILTYQQLLALLEKELEYQQIDPTKVRLPKGSRSDFSFQYIETDKEEFPIASLYSGPIPLANLDDHALDDGNYQFAHYMAAGRKSKRITWCAHLSIQAALWLVNSYIDKFLVPIKMSNRTNKEIVVSKQKIREVLLAMLKKLES